MSPQNWTDPQINASEHIEENINAKRTALYGWYPGGSTWNRVQVDANGIMQTGGGSGGVVTVYQGGAPWAVTGTVGAQQLGVWGVTATVGNIVNALSTVVQGGAFNVTATVNQGGAGTNPWLVNDDMSNFQAIEQTLTANQDNSITFAQQVRLVRVKNFDTNNVVLAANASIASNTSSAADWIGVAPVANVPSVEYYPYKTTTIHLRSAGSSQVSVTGFY